MSSKQYAAAAVLIQQSGSNNWSMGHQKQNPSTDPSPKHPPYMFIKSTSSVYSLVKSATMYLGI